MQKNNNSFKKLKIKKEKAKKKTDGKQHRTTKPNVQTEVYNNNKKFY